MNDIEKAIELLQSGSRLPDMPHTMEEVDKACSLAVQALREKAENYQFEEDITLRKTAYDEKGIPYLIEAAGSEAKHIIDLLAAEKRGGLWCCLARLGIRYL